MRSNNQNSRGQLKTAPFVPHYAAFSFRWFLALYSHTETMNLFTRICIVLFVLAITVVWSLVWFRIISIPFIAAAFFGGHLLIKKKKYKLLIGAVCFVFATSILPVDVRFVNYSGLPRVVPLLIGMPTIESINASNRGEVWLAGCVFTGTEPKWIMVW